MKHMTTARTVATLTVAAALAACASGGMSGASGTAGTSTPSTGAGVIPPTNTGIAIPSTGADTAGSRNAPPTGAANSRNGTGVGNASLGGGLVGQPSGAAAVPGNSLSNIGSDARIVSAIDVANTDEIAAAMLARQRASSPRVRAFADDMLKDHTAMQTQDRVLAQNPQFVASDSAGVTREMRREDDAALVKLQNVPAGPGFDEMYIANEITAHKRTLALLNAAKAQTHNDQLQDMIGKAIPEVQEHLNNALALQTAMGWHS